MILLGRVACSRCWRTSRAVGAAFSGSSAGRSDRAAEHSNGDTLAARAGLAGDMSLFEWWSVKTVFRKGNCHSLNRVATRAECATTDLTEMGGILASMAGQRRMAAPGCGSLVPGKAATCLVEGLRAGRIAASRRSRSKAARSEGGQGAAAWEQLQVQTAVEACQCPCGHTTRAARPL